MRENSRKAWVDSDPGWWMSAHSSLVELKVVFKPPHVKACTSHRRWSIKSVPRSKGLPSRAGPRLSLIHQMIYFYYFKLCVFTVLYFISRERKLRRWRQRPMTRRSNTLTPRRPASPILIARKFFFCFFFSFLISSLEINHKTSKFRFLLLFFQRKNCEN